eukprot:15455701-Alexandrium_andersonii.AAC.1
MKEHGRGTKLSTGESRLEEDASLESSMAANSSGSHGKRFCVAPSTENPPTPHTIDPPSDTQLIAENSFPKSETPKSD